MSRKDRNNRKVAIALSLLLIFVSSMMIKSVHYHHDYSNIAVVSTAASHHAVVTTSDYCPICQYLFSPTIATTAFRIFFIAALLSIIYTSSTPRLFVASHRFFSLRAPPAICC